MSRSLHIDSISIEDFDNILSRYDKTVRADLKQLETARWKTIPEAVAERRAEQGSEAYLEKKELEQLVQWKLKHGTFRPKLSQLAASNSADDVRTTTAAAFKLYKDGQIQNMLLSLTKLKGIGPATASLIAAAYDPDNVPFFSDELFRWAHWDGQGDGCKKVGSGWNRAIGYNPKEYISLCKRVKASMTRLKDEGRDTSVVELEKVAYVLGKESVDVDAGTDGSSELKKVDDILDDKERKGGGSKRKSPEHERVQSKRSKRRENSKTLNSCVFH
jgi:hypothetical protein